MALSSMIYLKQLELTYLMVNWLICMTTTLIVSALSHLTVLQALQ